MMQVIDPVDNGLKFCSAKAHLQSNGGLLSEEQIASWQSQEVSKREKRKKPSGEARKKSLETHLEKFMKFAQLNPNNYWETYKKAKGEIISSILYLLDISVSSLNGVAAKRAKLIGLNLDKSRIDAMMSEVSDRIEMLTVSIAASWGNNLRAEARAVREEEEFARIQELAASEND